MLKHLVPLKDSATLIRWHVIQPGEAIQHSLLGLRGQIVETRLILQGSLLLFERQITVAVHPLSQMLPILL